MSTSVPVAVFSRLLMMAAAVIMVLPASAQIAEPVRVKSGLLSGVAGSDPTVRVFKGVPFAAPPVGELRWKEPQPVKSWKGVRKAERFGARPMQLPIYGDMVWRSEGISEDCLYLNVWTPAKSNKERLPVLVYFYGGGFVAGDSSEPRYDGESMARKGIVAITVNYRLGIFGFFAHPKLTRESPHHASGNYGLMDQSAAIQWVRQNVAAFGGDPKRITIGGESAGSFSVSAQMASPLSKNLIAGAIGESGAMLGPTLAAQPREQVEQTGVAFAKEVGADSLAALRALPAQQILDATKSNPFRFSLTIDGYFLPKSPLEIYTAGEQAHVPLLAGWNAEEAGAGGVLGKEPATVEGFTRALRTVYGNLADEALKAYGVSTNAEVQAAATALSSDRFIGYGTWKWTDLHGKTSGKPVYRYLYAHPRPKEGGAYHAVEIEYALGNLPLNLRYAWTEEDRKVSATMQAYFANFIKNGDPNGSGLPDWPSANRGTVTNVMRLDVNSLAAPAQDRAHYLFLDRIYGEEPQSRK
jgi:para-nitrobenzyl esterase